MGLGLWGIVDRQLLAVSFHWSLVGVVSPGGLRPPLAFSLLVARANQTLLDCGLHVRRVVASEDLEPNISTATGAVAQTDFVAKVSALPAWQCLGCWERQGRREGPEGLGRRLVP